MRTSIRWIVAGALLASAMSCGGSSDGDKADDADRAGSSQPPPAAEWRSLGRDLANSRAAVDETTIGPANVAQLQPAWELSDLRGVSGTPIIVDGSLYIGDWTGHLRALDPDTGEELWAHDLETYYVGGAVAVDDERVFVGTFDARVVALDRATGEPAWETPIGDHPQAAIFGSPLVTDGLVIIGVASYEEFGAADVTPTSRGHVVALDAATGAEVWRYWTTAGDAVEGPGVPVWSSPTIDTERGHVYITTGNNYAPPSSPRADSVLALDVKTGQELWVRQFTKDDHWTLNGGEGPDADLGAPPNLFEVDGVAALGVGDKAGAYRAVNRETGEVLWEAQLTTGGLEGGILASGAFEGDSVYVASNEESREAELFGLRVETGEVRWRVEVGGKVSGPVTWSNGVVFVADDSGHISGFDAEDGTKLWSHEVAAQAAGGIAVVDGTVYAGWGWWLAAPPQDAKGGLTAFRVGGSGAGSGSGSAGAGSGSGDDLGKDVYQQSCAGCHGGSGTGGSGPSLVDVEQRLTLEAHLELVREGKGKMPGWEDTLSAEELEAVVEYERTVLSDGDG